jgi:hypothetical protein
VISVQLAGTKRFHYAPVREIANPYGMQYGRGELPYDELYTQVPNGFPDETGVKFETAEMKPGSVLFLPRATWHYTEADEPSLSLSIILRPVTLIDCALEQLRWLLLQDSAWREPTYGSTATGATHQKLREHAARLLERLPEVAGSLSPEDLIGTTTPAAKRLEQISDKTRFQKIPNAVLQVDERGATRGMATVTIRLPQPETSNDFSMQMDVGPALVAVFRWIDTQRKPFTGADLHAAFPQLAAADRKKLLDLLTRAQFIKMLWFPELPKHARVGDAETVPQ